MVVPFSSVAWIVGAAMLVRRVLRDSKTGSSRTGPED